jgi:hypothetical protein
MSVHGVGGVQMRSMDRMLWNFGKISKGARGEFSRYTI